MRSPIVLAVTLACAAAAPALANDTSAELAAGGLLFVHNDDVEMRSEKLFISAREVRVTYEFFNKSDKDVTVLVAFPLPEIRVAGTDDNIVVPTDDPANPFGFATSLNGSPVKTEVERRVTAVGIDRTQYLRRLGIPLDPHLPATNTALDALPQDTWADLVELGLGEVVEYDDTGKGMKKHLEARWGLATTYYWTQTFPAKKQTIIQHAYKPSVGGAAQTELGSPSQAKESWYADHLKKYCVDQGFLTTIQNLRKASKSEFGPPYAALGYVYDASLGDGMRPRLLPSGLVQVPFVWQGVDGFYYLRDQPVDPAEVRDQWLRTLDRVAETGGLFLTICHAFITGVDAARLAALDAVMAAAVADRRVVICTVGEVAADRRGPF